MSNLKKLGAGWREIGLDVYRRDCTTSVYFKASKVSGGWVLVRFEDNNGTNGVFFTSLKKLVEHLSQN
jgi:hypothetical protein